MNVLNRSYNPSELSLVFHVHEEHNRNHGKSIRKIPYKAVNNDVFSRRYYYSDIDRFEELLNIYNQENVEKNGPIECVGHVNTSMKMCSVCGDTGKSTLRKDRYYVIAKEVAQNRTILCHGCVGFKLKIFDLPQIVVSRTSRTEFECRKSSDGRLDVGWN